MVRAKTIVAFSVVIALAFASTARAQSPEPSPSSTDQQSSQDAGLEYQAAIAELQRLETQSSQLATQYDITLAGIDRLQAETADLKTRIADLKDRAKNAQSSLDAFTILTYKFGSPTINDFDLLIDGGDLNDLVRARKYLDIARGAGRSALSRWRGNTQALATETDRLNKVEAEYEQLLVDLESRREEMEALTARQFEIVENAKDKFVEARLAEQVAALSGRIPVPAELLAFGNGRIPASALTLIGVGSHRLWGPAALAFIQMNAAAAGEGVVIGVTDSYRSYAAQVDVARRKGLYKNGGLAATPGTSNHGWGLALDLKLDYRAQQWMRANAGRFGYVEDVPREPWHWGYHGSAGLTTG